MSKILYVGNEILDIKSGSDSVNKRNLDILMLIFGKDNIIIKNLAISNSLFEKLKFYIGGLNEKVEADIIRTIQYDEEIKYVFLSQSLLGRLARTIRNRFEKKIKIITFYHNIEKHYAKEYIKTAGISHYPFYYWASFNEKLAVKFTDYHVVLNERDALKLKEFYNIEANLIIPATYKDIFDPERAKIATKANDYLFVGTSFFANIEAMRWFIKFVMPNVNGNLTIIGKGMDLYKEEFESKNTTVHGYVDDLSKYYYESNVVIAPIFSGGGMKTKIAEALMYGKLILGSTEAFEGYVENSKAMLLCESAEDYVKYLNSEEYMKLGLYNQNSRECFIKNYSNDVVLEKLKSIFND